MSRRDGTGPMGIGAMAGRGNRRQYCVAGKPCFLRSNYLQNSVEINEKTLLCNQETILENQLKQIKDRLSKITKESE